MCADDEEAVEMAHSRSSAALPTKAALICAAEPAAALRLGRGLVSHGLGGAKRIDTDVPALGGASATPRRRRRFDGGRASTSDDGCDRTGVCRKWKK